MLSIVPLFAGGGMFETGAGGSAPKQMQQLVAENHLRWDSLGEFLALTASLEHLARVEGNAQAALLAAALDRATARYLEENRGPGRVAGTPDNRAAHYYLARFWADELAQQTEDIALSAKFTQLARTLEKEEANILTELASGAGVATDLGGYYHFDTAKAATVMRPSATLNQAIASI
jgi:isocitrate dehydrogenase